MIILNFIARPHLLMKRLQSHPAKSFFYSSLINLSHNKSKEISIIILYIIRYRIFQHLIRLSYPRMHIYI